MRSLAFIALATVPITVAAVQCPKLKPDGSIPPCALCPYCELPDAKDPTYNEVLLPRLYGKFGSRQVWIDPVGGKPAQESDFSMYRVTAEAPRDGSATTRVTLSVERGAPKKFRVFSLSQDRTMVYWLTNGNEEGAVCQITTNTSVSSFPYLVDVVEWGSVPGCF